jgi:hypothetical protein
MMLGIIHAVGTFHKQGRGNKKVFKSILDKKRDALGGRDVSF